ncbi:N-acetylmuramoyl-L-alanine amidase [Rhodococcus sp. IEGM1300]
MSKDLAKARMYLIALDDGHGKDTPGKRTPFIEEIQRQIQENEFNKEVVKLLDIELRRAGFRTVLTAPTDADTPLATRVKTANDAKASLFVSVHFNAIDGKFDGPSKDPEGFSAHIDPSGGLSQKFAEIALKHLAKGKIQKNRGLVKQQLYVTANTKMPAVLFELGFMDNAREALLMLDKSFQAECAMELAMGVCEFYGVAYVPAQVKPAVVKPKSLVKRGTAVMKQDVVVYAQPKFGTQTGGLIKKGEERHIYDVKNGWYQIFSGEWIPSNYEKNFSYTAVEKKKPAVKPALKPVAPPAAKPADPKKTVHRVIADGKQLDAFTDKDNALARAGQALDKGETDVQIKKVQI